MSKFDKIPDLKTEADERAFWENHDSGDYVDWTQAQLGSFPKLKPSTKNYIAAPAGNSTGPYKN